MAALPNQNRDQGAFARGRQAGCQEGLLRAAILARDQAARAFLAGQDPLAFGLRELAGLLEAEAKKRSEE